MVSVTSNAEESDSGSDQSPVVVSMAVFSDDIIFQDKPTRYLENTLEDKYNYQREKDSEHVHDRGPTEENMPIFPKQNAGIYGDGSTESESRVCRKKILFLAMSVSPQERSEKRINEQANIGTITSKEHFKDKTSVCPWQKNWENQEIDILKQDFDSSYNDEFPDINLNRRTSNMLKPHPEVKCEKEKVTSKKKKIRKLTHDELGFTFHLQPRHVLSEPMTETEETEFWSQLDINFDDIDEKISNGINVNGIDDTCYSKCVRKDRHRKIRKAHHQVKDKYCRSVRNNKGRQKLFVHHRVYKIMQLECQKLNYLPSRSKHKKPEVETKLNIHVKPTRHRPPAPVQNLAYVLHEDSSPAHLEDDMISILMTLQHRDLTPEDYELLLRLDESVAPKTLSMDILKSFKTDKAGAEAVNDICLVCMENYELHQERKFLPCNHIFHSDCIDRWLTNSSLNCPIDGLPLS